MRVFQVDAFTDEPYSGNPAAVCILKDEVGENWMQKVAGEMNLSETAFLQPIEKGYNLRWFTPATEIDLCGHATLASAHVLWEEGYTLDNEIIFHTKSGRLTAVNREDWIELDFPVQPPKRLEPPSELMDALGAEVEIKYCGMTQFDYLVEVGSERVVRKIQLDLNKLRRIDIRGVIITSGPSSQFDFISRFFAPSVGIDEDPVTGSAHCTLAPYWSSKLNKIELTGYQASARGGVVKTRLIDERVILGGQAITVLKGDLLY